MPAVSVRRLGPDDYQLVRAIRLRCLREEAASFGSTYEREVAFTDAVWIDRLRPEGNPHYLAEAPDGTPAGIAAGVPDDTDTDVANLVAMWVDPRARGTGVADELIAAVIRWAEGAGYRAMRLHATEGNVRAERAYQRHGFQRTGRTFPRERDGSTEFEMARLLRETP
jgi:GNAT superfamily N-acetyltransferase